MAEQRKFGRNQFLAGSAMFGLQTLVAPWSVATGFFAAAIADARGEDPIKAYMRGSVAGLVPGLLVGCSDATPAVQTARLASGSRDLFMTGKEYPAALLTNAYVRHPSLKTTGQPVEQLLQTIQSHPKDFEIRLVTMSQKSAAVLNLADGSASPVIPMGRYKATGELFPLAKLEVSLVEEILGAQTNVEKLEISDAAIFNAVFEGGSNGKITITSEDLVNYRNIRGIKDGGNGGTIRLGPAKLGGRPDYKLTLIELRRPASGGERYILARILNPDGQFVKDVIMCAGDIPAYARANHGVLRHSVELDMGANPALDTVLDNIRNPDPRTLEAILNGEERAIGNTKIVPDMYYGTPTKAATIASVVNDGQPVGHLTVLKRIREGRPFFHAYSPDALPNGFTGIVTSDPYAQSFPIAKNWANETGFTFMLRNGVGLRRIDPKNIQDATHLATIIEKEVIPIPSSQTIKAQMGRVAGVGSKLTVPVLNIATSLPVAQAWALDQVTDCKGLVCLDTAVKLTIGQMLSTSPLNKLMWGDAYGQVDIDNMIAKSGKDPNKAFRTVLNVNGSQSEGVDSSDIGLVFRYNKIEDFESIGEEPIQVVSIEGSQISRVYSDGGPADEEVQGEGGCQIPINAAGQNLPTVQDFINSIVGKGEKRYTMVRVIYQSQVSQGQIITSDTHVASFQNDLGEKKTYVYTVRKSQVIAKK